MLDDVEEVLVRMLLYPSAVGEVSGTDQEQRRPPGPPAIDAVTRGAECLEQPLGPRGPGRRLGHVENTREPPGERADGNQNHHQRDHGPAHPLETSRPPPTAID